MANVPISDLTALAARPATDDYFVIVDTSEALDADKTKKIAYQYVGPTFLTTPLTSTSWDGDTKTTGNRGIIDLSAVFGVPAGVKAIIAYLQIKDSNPNVYGRIGPSETYNYTLTVRTQVANIYSNDTGIVPCDSNGDIYFYNSEELDEVFIQIWGYWL
jgi:hypothetical protein